MLAREAASTAAQKKRGSARLSRIPSLKQKGEKTRCDRKWGLLRSRRACSLSSPSFLSLSSLSLHFLSLPFLLALLASSGARKSLHFLAAMGVIFTEPKYPVVNKAPAFWETGEEKEEEDFLLRRPIKTLVLTSLPLSPPLS